MRLELCASDRRLRVLRSLAHHLAALVSELPDQQSTRKIAGTGFECAKKKGGSPHRFRSGRDSGAKRKGIHMPDGSIWTGFYAEWDQLSEEDRQTVIDTRAKNNAKGGRKGRQVSEVGTSAKKLKAIKSKMADLQRTLAAIKAKQVNNAGDDGDNNASDTPDNAGNSFGGATEKEAKERMTGSCCTSDGAANGCYCHMALVDDAFHQSYSTCSLSTRVLRMEIDNTQRLTLAE